MDGKSQAFCALQDCKSAERFARASDYSAMRLTPRAARGRPSVLLGAARLVPSLRLGTTVGSALRCPNLAGQPRLSTPLRGVVTGVRKRLRTQTLAHLYRYTGSALR
jgi:hypothetical protein